MKNTVVEIKKTNGYYKNYADRDLIMFRCPNRLGPLTSFLRNRGADDGFRYNIFLHTEILGKDSWNQVLIDSELDRIFLFIINR